MALTLEEQLKIFNWFYKLGEPMISDIKYNQLFEQLKRENPNSEVITKTWSELGKPVEELKKVNLLEKADSIESSLTEKSESRFFLPEENMKMRDTYYRETLNYFDQFIPKSIETIESVGNSREWLDTLKDGKESVELHFSIKADGFNISLFYYQGYFVGAMTRGRSGTSLDVSIAMSKVVPLKIDVIETFTRIKVEAVMEKDRIEELRKLDPSREWKSPRNSIRTLLMNDIGEKFNKFITPLAFKIEGKRFNNLNEEYMWLASQGFKTVEYDTLTISTNDELLNSVREFSNMELIYANDGCVVTVNKRNQYEQFETSGKYDYAMRAFRLFNWQSNIYCSILLGVEPSYNSKRISLGLKILPTKVSNGSTIGTLDADNLSRIQFSQVKKGSIVCFHMRSDSCVDWLDIESRKVNDAIKSGTKIPEHLIQPVAELEDRIRDKYKDKIAEYQE